MIADWNWTAIGVVLAAIVAVGGAVRYVLERRSRQRAEERTAKANLPQLRHAIDGRKASIDPVEVRIVVYNDGGGPARSVVVHTSWGDATIAGSIDPEQSKEAVATTPQAQWDKSTNANPTVTGYTFTNRFGQKYNQPDGEEPTQT